LKIEKQAYVEYQHTLRLLISETVPQIAIAKACRKKLDFLQRKGLTSPTTPTPRPV
jgi:hypothetical protein